jgi:trimethylamine-N-oxide reductase (cytochrome c)
VEDRSRGKTFEPLTKATTGYLQTTWKKRVYSPNRILYPLKRVDWEPGGDPAKMNTQTRGKSKYKRISWDEATTIVANEIKRIQDKYGQYGVMTIAEYIHGEAKNVHAHGGTHTRLFNKMGVKYTREIRCTGSQEAGYIGGYHIYGTPGYPSSATTLDIAQNTEQLVTFGGDWETITSSKATQMARAFRWFIQDLGIQYVSIDPRLNYSAAVLANKWIPILPNTDAALLLGVIHTWITEGTYDKEYVATHTVGMDKVSDYVLGKEDGTPKTPAWAATKCGVPEWTIKALAREWAKKKTSVSASSNGMRTPYCHEYYRLEAIALGMQGLGKPGIHRYPNGAAPRALNAPNVKRPYLAMGLVESKQGLPKGTVAEGILTPPLSYYSTDAWAVPAENQFKKWQYPIPKEEGGTEIHMMWDESSCHTSCYTAGFRYMEAMRKPTIECYLIQHPTMENDCLLADLVLPVTWAFEETDILSGGDQIRSMVLMKQNVKPIGEAKSDYEITGMIAQKLEKLGGAYAGAYTKYTEGKTVDQWIKDAYENSGVKDKITWEKFSEKGIYVAPVDPTWKDQKSGIIDFVTDPVKNPLKTPSGKLEFYSQRLADNFPDDKERNPVPKWVEGGPGFTNDESLWGERAKKYPLLMSDTIRRWGHHSLMSDVPWLAEVPTARIKGYDGHRTSRSGSIRRLLPSAASRPVTL